MTTTRNYKIVPIETKDNDTKIKELRAFLTERIESSIRAEYYEGAAEAQQHLDLVDLLVENSRDRI